MPLVSVNLAVYNGQEWLDAAIQSVLSQTFEDFELVIINDASTDDSEKVINKHLHDKRIRYIKHVENEGCTPTRNHGLHESRGEYIAFIDQDDLWDPTMLECQVARFRNADNNLGMIYTDYYELNYDCNQRKLKEAPFFADKKKFIKELFLHNFIAFQSVMIRKECFRKLGYFDERLLISQDWDMWFRIAEKYDLQHIASPLLIRGIHGGNLSKNMEQMYKDCLLIIGKVLDRNSGLQSVKRRTMSYLEYDLGRYYQSEGSFHRARSALWKSIRYRPSRVKPLLALLLSFLGHWGNRLFRAYRDVRVGMERNATI